MLIKRDAPVRLVALVLASLALVGCTAKYTPLSVRTSNRSTQIQWRPCASKDQIMDLALYKGKYPVDTKHQEPLWAISVAGAAGTRTVTLGEAPPGFRVDAPMTTILQSDAQYTLLANFAHPIAGYVTFRPSQLQPGLVIFEDDQVKTVTAYDRMSNEDFGCP